ncbi:alpha-hydroxy-acid oxidizing protein [Nonomuraea sp. KC401]|uniref:alpha-hydroxy acid oxidase n=1 Tax=unclassified Nonomuraea TaxID=2593643 RepID=UPI0010FD3B5A|nr:MULTISPECIES: alpha-hydroxy acid oxidase [unclassified Nonomuraea]NBE92570.1 alpha-hydroxy-acid oxidizing protein [Nonomuraea sp. K271]TLF79767.1 alpha-hydroxy-acid oxidizing protein [Nonomuraea sp. KC401]
MSRTRAERILSTTDARRRARKALPRALFDYIDGGAEEEATLAANVRAFQEHAIRPRVGIAVEEPNMTTTVLGTPLALPVLLAPCGMVQLVHPDGAVGVARAASAAGTVAVLSRTAMCPPEEVGQRSPGPNWFHVNSAGGRDAVKRDMARAAESGFEGLVVTLDGPPPGNREGESRHGLVPPIRLTPQFTAHLAAHFVARPRWVASMLLAARQQISTIKRASTLLSSGTLHRSARFTWADIEWMRSEWADSLLVKGVLSGHDAIAARDVGADAVIVSNHGGRALDGAPATMRVLPEIVAAVGPETEVLLDGGVRRATCVIKALSLGARAVLIGRPFVYGLAFAGQPGVERIIEIFRSELARNMKLMGCAALSELNPSWLQPSHLPPVAAASRLQWPNPSPESAP